MLHDFSVEIYETPSRDINSSLHGTADVDE